MMHFNREWSVREITTADELAEKLSSLTWCCCQAFSIGNYLWLNDATSPDGAQEYAVLKREGDRLTQIESITMSWMNREEILDCIRETLTGKDDNHDFRQEVTATLQTPAPADIVSDVDFALIRNEWGHFTLMQ